MRAVIYGITGFLGRAIMRALLRNPVGISIVGITRTERPVSLPQSIELHTGPVFDIRNPDAIAEIARGAKCFIDASGVLPGAQPMTLRNYATQQVGLARAIAACGVPLYIGISSGGTIYGHPHVMPVPEDHPLEPVGDYGASKFKYELGIQEVTRAGSTSSATRFVVLRPSNIIGKGMSFNARFGVIPNFIRGIEIGEITLVNGGRTIRDYLDEYDFGEAVQRIALKGVACQYSVYNIGSGTGVSTAEILRMIIQHYNSKDEWEITLRSRHEKDAVQAIVLDNRRIRKDFDWAPMAASEAVERCVVWYCQNTRTAGNQ